jgi:hypothetical protein
VLRKPYQMERLAELLSELLSHPNAGVRAS